MLENRSIHCTHCQVAFKVLFLLEISLHSQRCLSSLVADRQVVLQMVVQVSLLCSRPVLCIALIVRLPSKSCFLVGDFSPISKMFISSLCAVRQVVLQMVVQVYLLCLNTVLCIAHPVM